MTTSYPTSIQSLPNPTGTDLLENATAALDHDYQHTTVNDTLFALQTKVGITGSAVTTTHEYKLSGVATGDKSASLTGAETLSNKTLTAPQLNFGADATGDMYYRNSSGVTTRLPAGTDGQIISYLSGLPITIPNPSASDGSTTVKGVFEEATAAEIQAGTAVGATGARLVVNPSKVMPSGTVAMYAGITAPGGWLFCDGSAVSRTTYANLFAILSTAYGVGDGSTTFNVPDFRGRSPIGAGTGTGGGASGTGLPAGGSALTPATIASWKGEETHILTTPEMPSHNHNVYGSSVTAGGDVVIERILNSVGVLRTDAVFNTGGGGAHNNIQPVMGINFIIAI